MTCSPFHSQALAEQIARYLDRCDLARCVQVCKSWYESLVPLLYRQVTYDLPSRDNASLWAGVQRHSRHLRILTVVSNHFPEPAILGPECHNLTELYLGPLDFVLQAVESHKRFQEFASHNPSIHTIQIDLRKHLSSVLFRDGNILRHMPALKNLTILDDRYPYSQGSPSNGAFEAMQECGSRLETLSYQIFWPGLCSTANNRVDLDQDDGRKDPQLWTGLSSLTLSGYDGWREVELVKRCPNLKELNALFKEFTSCNVLGQMAQHYSSGHPSCLEHLTVSYFRGGPTPTALEELLQACAGTTGLKTMGFSLSYLSATTAQTLLQYHGNTLEKLTMVRSHWAHPLDLHRLVTTCSRLRHLVTTVDGGKPWLRFLVRSPWACTDLRVLHLTICQDIIPQYGGEPHESSSGDEAALERDPGDDNEHVASPQRQFWKQIGALKSLESLQLKVDAKRSSFSSHLTMEQEDVEQLCGLTRLWELQVPSGPSFMADATREDLRQRRPGLRIAYG